MQIVIDIDEETLKEVNRCGLFLNPRDKEKLVNSIKHGTPLPKGHGKLKDIDKFLKRVEEARAHEEYMRSWTIDDVLQKLDSWYAPTVIEADNESEGEEWS